MMLSHSHQVTSKTRMSLHQKSRKMRKCVPCHAFSRSLTKKLTRYSPFQPRQAAKVGPSSQRRAPLDAFRVSFGCCIITALSAVA